MTDLDVFQQVVSTAGGGGSVAILVIMWRLGLFNAKQKNQEILDEFQALKQYFNHDTTNYHERTHEKLDKVADSLSSIFYNLRDIKENGIPCKEKK